MSEVALTPRQASLIDELFADLPADAAERLSATRTIRDQFHSAMARALEMSINETLAAAPQSTLDERRDLASSLNSTLRSLSLAIRCPRTDRPATLIVDTLNGDNKDVSRFRLNITNERGKMQRTVTWKDLQLPLELMPAGERIEGRSRGHVPRTGPHR